MLQVWPGSHARIHDAQWAALVERGETHTKSRRGVSPKEAAPGYEVMEQIKRDTRPFDTAAPKGSVCGPILVSWNLLSPASGL